jgi:dipeptidyl aminopeptidase/acylaminoacyl peptidase
MVDILPCLRKALFAAACIAIPPGAIPANAADPAKPGAEVFFSNPKITEAELSPDGKFVAIVTQAQTGRMVLAVMDLNSTSPKLIAGFGNADVIDIAWVNNERLIYSTTDYSEAPMDFQAWPGLFAINRDGTDERTLVDRNPYEKLTIGSKLPPKGGLPADTFFFDVDRSGTTDNIYVEQLEYSSQWDVKGAHLMRVNTRNGHVDPIEHPESTVGWLIDQKGVPRVNVTENGGTTRIFYHDPATDKWRKLAEFDAVTGTGGFTPAYFGSDGTLYVRTRKGRDTSALYRYDLEKNAIDGEPLISVKGYDFNGGFIVSEASKKLLGVRYTADAPGTIWFDPGMKKIQATVDAALPATINSLRVARSGNTDKILVRAFSDTQPAMWMVFDTVNNKLVKLGASHPDVDPKQMASQEMVHYKARDGLEIPAYISIPQGSSGKNLPLVVLVHGGPYVRGAVWGWDPDVQFLASRGYAVLQPEFRGSTGFGEKHFKAGWKQWGLAMQDDIADGTRWAIAQGIADPKRICIAGASYGGYATLMGLARDPDLYRCGVEWVGVTDISLMFKSDWRNDASTEQQRYGMPVLIGDPVKDAQQIKDTSPINLASRVKQPLLMAYGGVDRRVPLAHGKNFRDAVLPTNKNVEWVEYPEEGHGWRLVKNRVDFWNRVDKFLAANIGSQTTPAAR